MKTITLGELFTEQQLRAASAMLKCDPPLSRLHDKLVAVLEPDKPRFDSLNVLIPYAAYVLEWQRDKILEVYG